MRFYVFQKEINLTPNKVNKINLACCYLHDSYYSEVIDILKLEEILAVNDPLLHLQKQNFFLTLP
jgi:hypothetical protein